MKTLNLIILLLSIIVMNTHSVPGEAENKHSHVFLVKTDLTKEQVEELLKKVESNMQTEGTQLKKSEAVELKEAETVNLKASKTEKIDEKVNEAKEKIDASAEQREEKNQIVEDKIAAKEAKAAEKEYKAAQKEEVAELKRNEKELKVADKQANELKKEEFKAEVKAVKLLENSKKKELKQKNEDAQQLKAAQTNLLRVNPGQEVGASSIVALFLILFVFVALILLGTQYQNVKKHLKLDLHNEGLKDYLLVDQKEENSHSDYPSIRDF